MVDAVVAAFGRLDILVNSAGIALKGNIETATLDEFRRTEAVNVEGTFLGCREAIRAMKGKGGGSIVNLSSVAGIIGDAQSAAYCASKGAVRLLTKSAALHCGRAGYNIRLNSVHPSFADTPMVQELIASSKNPERVREGLMRAAPMGRMGRAEEVANAILYLASDESSFTTGDRTDGRRRSHGAVATCRTILREGTNAMRVQVCIIGGGPSGLLLSQLLHLKGVDTIVLERQSREYVLGRIRAGVLEHGFADLMREAQCGERMDLEGEIHHGFFIAHDGKLDRVDLCRNIPAAIPSWSTARPR